MITLSPTIDKFLSYPAKPELIGYAPLREKESLVERMAKTVSLIRQAEKRYVVRLEAEEFERAAKVLAVRDRLALHLRQQASRLTLQITTNTHLQVAA